MNKFRIIASASAWLLLGVALSGCGRTLRLGAYAPIVQEFEQASRQYGRAVKVDNLIIETSDALEPHIAADCLTGGWSTPTIRLNRRGLRWASPEFAKLVVFHELGHCVLDRNHTRALRRNGRPASIMYPSNVPLAVFQADPEYYLWELFTGRTETAARLSQSLEAGSPRRTVYLLPNDHHPRGGCVLDSGDIGLP